MYCEVCRRIKAKRPVVRRTIEYIANRFAADMKINWRCSSGFITRFILRNKLKLTKIHTAKPVTQDSLKMV